MTAIPTRPQRLRVRLTAAALGMVRGGHPWVFASSVLETNRVGYAGELAVIYDRQDRFLAVGLYDPTSPIRVRILHAGKPLDLNDDWWQKRAQTAINKRADLFKADTTGYRLIHGESDGWPGLVLDRYGDTLALKIYTPAWFPWLERVTRWIGACAKHDRLILRLSRNIQGMDQTDKKWEDGMMLDGNLPSSPVLFLEQGLTFEADVVRGQKTGFFLDQRENRMEVARLADGRSVLNAFSFSGGFSVHAARGGAVAVTDLDISAHALSAARRNMALNRASPAVSACRHEVIQANAFDWLEASRDKFGMVILDPPALAKRASERSGALHAYERLAGLGADRLDPNGILVAGSCSSQVSANEFFRAVRKAAGRSGKRFQEMATRFHPGDHPAGFKEAEYLKMIYLRRVG